MVFREIEFAAQFFANQRQHRIVLGARQIAHANLGDIAAPTGRAHRNDRLLAATAPGNHLHLAAETVTGIQHQIHRRSQQRIQIARGDKLRVQIQVDVRIDRTATLGHRLDLGAPELSIQRRQLPVGIGHAQIIGIDQGQPADTAARQRFHRP